LKRLGWKVLTVWECETRDVKRLTDRLSTFLSR
jgi:G:T-mismatch repair DNA endonuclease (very short patch repair protein)